VDAEEEAGEGFVGEGVEEEVYVVIQDAKTMDFDLLFGGD
jgi:hypothetical protein